MDMCRKCCYCSEQGGKCALYQSRYDDMEPEAVRKAAKDNVAAEHGRPEIFLFAVKNLCSQGETHYGAAGRILEKGLEAGDEACLSYLISLHYIITYADRNGTIKKLDQIYTSPLTDKVFSDCKYYLRYEKFGDLAASSTNRQHLLWASRFYQIALENYSDHYSTEAPDFPARISEKLDDCHATWFALANDLALCKTLNCACATRRRTGTVYGRAVLPRSKKRNCLRFRVCPMVSPRCRAGRCRCTKRPRCVLLERNRCTEG